MNSQEKLSVKVLNKLISDMNYEYLEKIKNDIFKEKLKNLYYIQDKIYLEKIYYVLADTRNDAIMNFYGLDNIFIYSESNLKCLICMKEFLISKEHKESHTISELTKYCVECFENEYYCSNIDILPITKKYNVLDVLKLDKYKEMSDVN